MNRSGSGQGEPGEIRNPKPRNPNEIPMTKIRKEVREADRLLADFAIPCDGPCYILISAAQSK
jgi:hypothetical protein